MRKLTENQSNTLSCLSSDFMQLKDVCDKYALVMAKKGYSPNGYVWKNEVGNCLNSLIKRGLVEYQYKGLYKLAQ